MARDDIGACKGGTRGRSEPPYPLNEDHYAGTSPFSYSRVQLSHVSSTPAAILQQFVQSVLIQTQLVTAEGSLLPSQLCVEGPLRASQKLRMELTRRLLGELLIHGV